MNMVSNSDMADNTHSAGNSAMLTDNRTACDTSTPSYRRMGANANIVCNLHLVIYLYSLFQHGISQGPTVYSGTSPNLDVVTNLNATQLIDFLPMLTIAGKAKSIGADYCTTVNDYIGSDTNALINCYVGM